MKFYSDLTLLLYDVWGVTFFWTQCRLRYAWWSECRNVFSFYGKNSQTEH